MTKSHLIDSSKQRHEPAEESSAQTGDVDKRTLMGGDTKDMRQVHSLQVKHHLSLPFVVSHIWQLVEPLWKHINKKKICRESYNSQDAVQSGTDGIKSGRIRSVMHQYEVRPALNQNYKILLHCCATTGPEGCVCVSVCVSIVFLFSSGEAVFGGKFYLAELFKTTLNTAIVATVHSLISV